MWSTCLARIRNATGVSCETLSELLNCDKVKSHSDWKIIGTQWAACCARILAHGERSYTSEELTVGGHPEGAHTDGGNQWVSEGWQHEPGVGRGYGGS